MTDIPRTWYARGMTMTQGAGTAARARNGEHPIYVLTWRMEAAAEYADRLDAWTRDEANDPAPGDEFAESDWEWKYRQMRIQRRRVRHLHIAILRMQVWLYGEDPNTLAALAKYGR